MCRQLRPGTLSIARSLAAPTPLVSDVLCPLARAPLPPQGCKPSWWGELPQCKRINPKLKRTRVVFLNACKYKCIQKQVGTATQGQALCRGPCARHAPPPPRAPPPNSPSSRPACPPLQYAFEKWQNHGKVKKMSAYCKKQVQREGRKRGSWRRCTARGGLWHRRAHGAWQDAPARLNQGDLTSAPAAPLPPPPARPQWKEQPLWWVDEKCKKC